jgi:quercetin dioxygenase-like cupin family protein
MWGQEEEAVTHVVIRDIATEVEIQSGAVVSKVVHRGEGINVTVFGFDAGQELTDQQAARAAIVQVITGRLRFTADGEDMDARPGFWLHMKPNTPHALVATEPTVMLLTLL